MNTIPMTSKKTPQGEFHMDIYSRLLDSRVVMLDGEVNDQSASLITAQLLYLESVDPDADISLYINSPGGSVSAGMGIIDTMNLIKPDVVTIGCGMSASMGAVILASGAKGKRYVLPHGEVMIHQPLGGTQGQATDIVITAEHIKSIRKTINHILAEATGRDYDEIDRDTERDNYMSAQEAVDYGLVDAIISKH
ncbi:ATP-dependent Clp protease proteolytic subunit [Alistipes putredinis]|jgi:ATP-dependent Clp protease protease subunit|uniref:ATP-dependent Clp protease proteolytic subunit n=1 Tax=Alistipes putredinis TaxID=28117 RepID=UPI003AB17265